MGSSNENPKKYEVSIIPFFVKENERGIEVPPKAKEYTKKMPKQEEPTMQIDVLDGERTIDGNIVSFTEGKTRRSGKLVSNRQVEEKRAEKHDTGIEMA